MQERRMKNNKFLAYLTLAMICLVSIFGNLVFSFDAHASDAMDVKNETLNVDPVTAGGEKEEGDILQKSLAISSDFTYQREGRSDPFMPFITDQRVEAQLEVEEKMLTGMQLFEPGQLTLVGIIKTSRGPLAMAQDSVGKGYPLREGMKIGRTGEIVRIVPNKVLIKEEAYKNARTKEIIYKTTEMVLKKEGVNE